MKKENIKVSIIIPVYNVQDYIDRCLNSILSQNISNYEIILVDDGSTDNSGTICDEFSSKYSFINTIHQKNRGLSGARNTGIKYSKGKYVMFIDSDDYIYEKADLDTLFNSLDCDVIQYKLLYYYEKNDKYIFLNDLNPLLQEKNIIDILNYKVNNGQLSISACDKIVRKSLIVNNDLFFEDGLLSEDIDWSIRLYQKIKSFKTLNMNIYVYRQNRKGSITNSLGKKNIDSLYKIISKWYYYDFKNNDYKSIILNYLAYQYLILISIANKNNCNKNMMEKIKKMKDILCYSENKKVKMCIKLIKVIGFEKSRFILKLYIILKNKGLIKI